MSDIQSRLKELFDRIPRRHTSENVKEIYSLLEEYEAVLQEMEGTEAYPREGIERLFETLDPIRATVKKSNDGKASKKGKDDLFDEASVALKDSVEEAMQLASRP
ncbi:MAG TPA: hypothetical protein VM843_09820 [Flavisolibacter sp.]|nr:hypothetical protein [Flavisolibacter sp.]